MVILYLPASTLDLETGIKTRLLSGTVEQVDDVQAELRKAKEWWESKFYYKPYHAPAYQNIINNLS